MSSFYWNHYWKLFITHNSPTINQSKWNKSQSKQNENEVRVIKSTPCHNDQKVECHVGIGILNIIGGIYFRKVPFSLWPISSAPFLVHCFESTHFLHTSRLGSLSQLGQKHYEVCFWTIKFSVKVHIFWEGHKILQNLHQLWQ